MTADQTILVQITGPDHPGISAGLLTLLADAGAEVHDIEQVVIQDRLTLGIVVTVPSGRDLLKEMLLFAWEQDLHIDFDVVDAAPPPLRPSSVVTVLGHELAPDDLADVTHAIAEAGGNISRIVQLSRYPVISYELTVSDGDLAAIRRELLAAAAANANFDVAVQREGIGRRAKRLVVIDVDSTLVQHEVIDLLADEAGCAAEVAALTAAAMSGELDFESALRQRVQLLAGLEVSALDRAWERLTLTPGARTFVRTLKRLGFRTAIVSGGFTTFTDRLRAELGIDYAFANDLEIVDGRLTGKLEGPIVDRSRKAEILAEVARLDGVPLEQTVAIGDGANDLDMLSLAGLGIAFNAKPLVQEAADTAVRVPYLDAILFVLGVSREHVELADIEDDLR
jgi:phosphoserine phosphatase